MTLVMVVLSLLLIHSRCPGLSNVIHSGADKMCSRDATPCPDHGMGIQIQISPSLKPLMLCAEVCHILYSHHLQCLASIPIPEHTK